VLVLTPDEVAIPAPSPEVAPAEAVEDAEAAEA
jgi:hypothetical protein